LQTLGEAYAELVRQRQGTVQYYALKVHRPRRPDGAQVRLRLYGRRAADAEQESTEQKAELALDVFHLEAPGHLSQPTMADAIGLAMSIRMERAAALLEGEAGLHEFRLDSQGPPLRCLVETTRDRLAKYEAPPGINRQGALEGYPYRRKYDVAAAQATEEGPAAEDAAEARQWRWKSGHLAAALAETLQAALAKGAWSILGTWT
jgi:hypothetical protein